MADKVETPQKKPRKASNKVRVKLPGIESYEKTLEFSAEGPGRVVVRLERLMGSDRIRITDPKYLSTLVERLEAEEASAWGSRSRLRKKAEKNRSRQLAIEGLMEPTEDMQDLYEHPVFRVNRVLNRLAMFDTNMGAGAVSKNPPIVQVDLFTPDDDTGRIFKTYPQHQIFHEQTLPYVQSRYSRVLSRQSRADLTRASQAAPASPDSRRSSAVARKTDASPAQLSKAQGGRPVKSTKSLYRAEGKPSTISLKSSELDVAAKPKSTSPGPPGKPPVSPSPPNKQKTNLKFKPQLIPKKDLAAKPKKDFGVKKTKGDAKKVTKGRKEGEYELDEEEEEGAYEEEEGEYEEEEEENDYYGDRMPSDNTDSLQSFMSVYGVPEDQNLVRDWQAFKSHLVERVYEESGGSADELYELAGEVIGTYDRQLETVDEFVAAREDTVRKQRQSMGLPADRKMAEKKLEEQREMELQALADEEDEEEEQDEGEGADAEKHWSSTAWSKNKSKMTTSGSKSKTNLVTSKSKANISGAESKSNLATSKSKANLSATKSQLSVGKSKSRTNASGKGEDEEEDDEEEEEEEEDDFNETDFEGEDEEEEQENEDGDEGMYDDDEE